MAISINSDEIACEFVKRKKKLITMNGLVCIVLNKSFQPHCIKHRDNNK